jgi:hypothetical protein
VGHDRKPSDCSNRRRFERQVLCALIKRAELVILDSTARLPVDDAGMIVPLGSAVLMVARARPGTSFSGSPSSRLSASGAQPIGAVFNAVPGIKGSVYVDGPRAEVKAAPVPVAKRQARRAQGSATAR